MEKPASASLKTVLQRLSEHLDALAAEVEGIEHAICDELGSTAPQAPGNLQRLQRLDFMRQSLEDTALLVLFLSRKSEGVVDASLAFKLRLEATRELLVNAAVSGTVAHSNTDGGDVDLF